MIIAVTGTPGTGKTKVAHVLAKRLGAEVISLAALVRQGKIPSAYDAKRKTRVVDERKLGRYLKPLLAGRRDVIIEGLLAHYIKADLTIVLRTTPAVLRRRLRTRKWPRRKIDENVEAEMIGVIAAEAGKNAAEIDTTGRSPRAVAAAIESILKNRRRKHSVRIDWLGD